MRKQIFSAPCRETTRHLNALHCGYKECNVNKQVNIIHQNLRSIGNSLDNLIEITCNEKECIVLGVTEHWKTEEEIVMYKLPGFKLISSYCRDSKQHGGSAVYVRNDIISKNLTEFVKMSERFCVECSAVECNVNNKKFVILCIYRPPDGDIKIFIEKIDRILSRLIHQTVFVVGDFNVHFLENNVTTHKVLSIFNSYAMEQTIFDYTRVQIVNGGVIKSCVDNIFTNETDWQACVLDTIISDHKAQKVSFQCSFKNKNPKVQIKRFYSQENIQLFNTYLNSTNWNNLYCIKNEEINKQWEEFQNIFLNNFNRCFPERRYYPRNKNAGIRQNPVVNKCKSELDLLYVISQYDPAIQTIYNEKRKEYNNILRENRATSFENEIRNSDNKVKSVWKIVNELVGSKNNKINMHTGHNPEAVAEDFNKYLINSVNKLVKNSQTSNQTSISISTKSIFISPVTERETLNIINELKNKSSCGFDEVPSKILKVSALEIVKPLTWIINNSFKAGLFPEALKLAIVTPVYKKGDSKNIENFRPISILSVFSKVFEKLMCNRITEFMIKFKLLSEFQHGYLKGRSTQTAIFQFIQQIHRALEEKNIPLGIFLDLSKAYDTLSHEVILNKLFAYGIRGGPLNWCASYLANRRQKVRVSVESKSYFSEEITLNMGIPQGSIMGPFLFVLYMNDLSNILASNKEYVINYADDTSLLIKAPTYNNLVQRASETFINSNNWFDDNKLILNAAKTNLILFSTNYNNVYPQEISLNSITFELTNDTKFLGIQIDNKLNWLPHITYISKKLTSSAYSIKILATYLSSGVVNIVYHSNFESILRYGIVFWGASSDVNRLFVIQKRCLRSMLGLKYGQSCRGKFKSVNMFTIHALYIYECLVFIFKHKQIFVPALPTTKYSIRNFNYTLPIHRLSQTENSTYYKCMLFFNKLPNSIKIEKHFNKYKSLIKQLLLNLEPYSIEEYVNM